jgi:ligand-binding sensor domain-containing protein
MRFDLESGDSENVSQLEYVGIYAMHQARDGALWFAGEEGAMRYDPALGEWQQFPAGFKTIPPWPVTDIVEDDAGLWFGTYGGGVAFYDGVNWQTWATEAGLGGNDTFAIVEDGSGAIWFAHDGDGLSRYDPATDVWQSYGESDGALDWPSHPGLDAEGNLWIGGYGELKTFDGQAWQTFQPRQLTDSAIFDIAFGPGLVRWFVTDEGLVRHDPTTDEWISFTAADHPLLSEVNQLLVASDGTVWVGGYEGLIQYDGTGWRTPSTAGKPPTWVNDMAEAPDGSLWLVGDGNLFHLDGERWVQFSWPGEGWTEKLAIGPDGVIWTGATAMARFDPSSGAWQVFTSADGLVGAEVRAIHVMPNGEVWVGTSGGVSRYVPGDS